MGILVSSSCVKLVAVPARFLSITGVSALTVTLSSSAASFSRNATSTLVPVLTTSSRVCLVKPERATATL